MAAEKLDPDQLAPPLQAALDALARSVTHIAVTAATMTGIAEQTLASRLEGFAAEAVNAFAQLAAKTQAVGALGTEITPGAVPLTGSARDRLRRLADDEQQVVTRLHAVIPASGQEPRSEALEHVLEHILYRRQEQVDFIRRALGDTT